MTSRALNRVVRFDSTTGAKIDDPVNGGLLNAPEALLFVGNFLFVANKNTSSILRYIRDPATGALDAGVTFAQSGSQGLVAPEYLTRAFINDPPANPSA